MVAKETGGHAVGRPERRAPWRRWPWRRAPLRGALRRGAAVEMGGRGEGRPWVREKWRRVPWRHRPWRRGPRRRAPLRWAPGRRAAAETGGHGDRHHGDVWPWRRAAVETGGSRDRRSKRWANRRMYVETGESEMGAAEMGGCGEGRRRRRALQRWATADTCGHGEGHRFDERHGDRSR